MKPKSDAWRTLPITQAQIDFMESREIGWHDDMTRGEASDAISEELETTPHPFSEEAFEG